MQRLRWCLRLLRMRLRLLLLSVVLRLHVERVGRERDGRRGREGRVGVWLGRVRGSGRGRLLR